MAVENRRELAAILAEINPRAALAMAYGQAVPGLYRATLVTSASLVAGQVYSADLDEPIGDDFFVTDVRSTVNRPLAFAGSIWKAQSDVYNAQNPNIDVRMQVKGGLSGQGYVINANFTPLELIAPPIAGNTSSPMLCNFLLGTMQTVTCEFVFNRAPADDENPTRVTISFKGWRVGCTAYLGLSIPQAREKLREQFGI
jgi:hypothetical protein